MAIREIGMGVWYVADRPTVKVLGGTVLRLISTLSAPLAAISRITYLPTSLDSAHSIGGRAKKASREMKCAELSREKRGALKTRTKEAK